MGEKSKLPRRDFLKQAAGVIGAATQAGAWAGPLNAQVHPSQPDRTSAPSAITYPRVFEGRQLKMISFPLGGVAAGSLGLGGRGQLRDWEIFNRPNQGFNPPCAFPAIWVQSGNSKPVAHVLEARILPPYQGEDGLGTKNAPGLTRLESAKFTGEYPLAHIEFIDRSLPVKVELEAFSPFIPHDPDDSGLPAAILRYRVTNSGLASAKVGIVFSIDNPVKVPPRKKSVVQPPDKRTNEYRSGDRVAGLFMSNQDLPSDDPMHGSFVLAAMPEASTELTHWRGWPKVGWWSSPLQFWESFSADGKLGEESDALTSIGALCQRETIPSGKSKTFTFLLTWHFPNRTPDWCGWSAPPGKGGTIIGNYYSTRFKDAWDAAEYTADHLEDIEKRTRLFAKSFRESTVPDVVKDAAGANLSTLASTTCFRTADGEFHGFEGSDDTEGCCFGNCTHVWNYETATAFLFPSFARSLRKVSFGYSEDDAGGIHARQLLPEGKPLFPYIATDGQMGQILHAYIDWKLSGDDAWLQAMWPGIKRSIAFAWEPGGWDANRTGVLNGVQHNTFDIEFFGPNPMCGIYYLGALRAGEEMARRVGDNSSAREYRKLFTQGSQWIDSHLFNGEFYIQKIQGWPADKIAPHLRIEWGPADTEHPMYQVGGGCLIDQLIGQCLADVAGLGPLVSRDNIQKTLRSIYRYNYRRTLDNYDNVERTYALNDEAAVVICDYSKAKRPRVPFPYDSEVWTGLEYALAALMVYSGMVDEGVEFIQNARFRYDGERRNPWDEPECGHHYARAMSSWTSFVALSGFRYDGAVAAVSAVPPVPRSKFQCFWASATGWGTFSYRPSVKSGTQFMIHVLAGTLSCQSCEIRGIGTSAFVAGNGKLPPHSLERHGGNSVIHFGKPILLLEGDQLRIELKA